MVHLDPGAIEEGRKGVLQVLGLRVSAFWVLGLGFGGLQDLGLLGWGLQSTHLNHNVSRVYLARI